MKKIAIMQPYVFPYLGYFSLIQASDVFIFYDDVHYIIGGWINRNQILINGKPFKFAIPVTGASPNKLISEMQTANFSYFCKKFIKQISSAYAKAPYFKAGINYINSVLNCKNRFISDVAINSITEFYNYIEIDKSICLLSHMKGSRELEKSDRLIYITKLFGGSEYINLMGGLDIYNKSYFKSYNINLNFVKPKIKSYKQLKVTKFMPGLSIIDIIMNNNKSSILDMINNYELI